MFNDNTNDVGKSKEEVKLVLMLGGEMVLGTVYTTDDYEIKIKKPVRVVVIPNPNDRTGSPSVGLAPWFQFAVDDEYDLNPSLIVTMGTPHPDFLTQYKAATSKVIQPASGIVVP